MSIGEEAGIAVGAAAILLIAYILIGVAVKKRRGTLRTDWRVSDLFTFRDSTSAGPTGVRNYYEDDGESLLSGGGAGGSSAGGSK